MRNEMSFHTVFFLIFLLFVGFRALSLFRLLYPLKVPSSDRKFIGRRAVVFDGRLVRNRQTLMT